MSEALKTLVPTQIVVNGVSHTLTLHPRSTLLDVLREHLDLIRRQQESLIIPWNGLLSHFSLTRCLSWIGGALSGQPVNQALFIFSCLDSVWDNNRAQKRGST
jgi:hypothetical protein